MRVSLCVSVFKLSLSLSPLIFYSIHFFLHSEVLPLLFQHIVPLKHSLRLSAVKREQTYLLQETILVLISARFSTLV